MGEDIRQVVGDSGRRYLLSRVLGEGNQGIVYAVEGSHLAVKIIDAKGSDEACERLNRQLALIKRLALDKIPIARPREMLQPPATRPCRRFVVTALPVPNTSSRCSQAWRLSA